MISLEIETNTGALLINKVVIAPLAETDFLKSAHKEASHLARGFLTTAATGAWRVNAYCESIDESHIEIQNERAKMRRLYLKNLAKLKQLADALHSREEAPLGLAEIETITSHFQCKGIRGEESPYLWAAAETSEHKGALPEIAEKSLIMHKAGTDDSYLIHALRYLLVTSNKNKREQLIQTYSHGEEYQLIMTVAEYLVQRNEIERGLRLMISTIPLLKTDHTTSDSIALWINELGMPEIKRKFIAEATEAAAQQDHNRAAILCWAANLIVS